MVKIKHSNNMRRIGTLAIENPIKDRSKLT